MDPGTHDRGMSLSAAALVLQTELAELVELALQVQHTKWSLVSDVPDVDTRLFGDIIADAWQHAEAIAEALRTRGFAPDARIPTIASNRALYPTAGGWQGADAVRGVGYALGRSAAWARERAEQCEAEPDLAGMLGAIGTSLDGWARAVLASSTV
jgi:DNA-binding ferritin-like protein